MIITITATLNEPDLRRKMQPEVEAQLLPFQPPHVLGLLEILKNGGRAGDFSDTGVGKTPCASAVCALGDYEPFVVSPLAVIPTWWRFFRQFGVKPLGVTNYEQLHNCKWYESEDAEATLCPFLERIVLQKQNPNPYASKKSKRGVIGSYRWFPDPTKKPKKILLIFDEAHRCRNPRTLNSVLLFTAACTDVSILMLSATMADKPENFVLIGTVLRLYPAPRMALSWIEAQNKLLGNGGGNNPMAGVHRAIIPSKVRRLRIRDLGAFFPSNRVIAECYKMENAKEIQEMYDLIDTEVERLKSAEDRSTGLAEILYARMRIEQLRVPTLIEWAKQYLEEGHSVPIFVNFNASRLAIMDALKEIPGGVASIHGSQTRMEREESIASFQADKKHVIVCNIASGGVGVSLHDLNGVRARRSLISLTWDAKLFVQALGRSHRAEGKTPVIQRIPFCAGTIEEEICAIIKKKIENIGALNDGDLRSYQIEGLIVDDMEKQDLTVDEEKRARIETLMAKRTRLLKELDETNKELERVNKGIW